MADWIYCGTHPPVDSAGTEAVLRAYGAIWCPPPRLRPWPPVWPSPGERIWLVWRDQRDTSVLLLGGGRLVGNGIGKFGTYLLHSNADLPGVREEAKRVGFGGPSNMSFLLVREVEVPVGGSCYIHGLGCVIAGLSAASQEQVAILLGVASVTAKNARRPQQ